MRHSIRCAASILVSTVVHASAVDRSESPVLVTPILSTSTTATGQPIVLPSQHAHVLVWIYDIAPGATLPEHKHPHPRYAYVLAGTLRITESQAGRSLVYRPGDFIVEAIGQWQQAESLNNEPVKLLVIDQVPGDVPNTVLPE